MNSSFAASAVHNSDGVPTCLNAPKQIPSVCISIGRMGTLRVIGAFILCLLISPSRAQIDPIENYLTSAEQKANNVVNNAGAQGRAVAMEAGQAALNAVASFRAAYADSLKLSENALTGQQAAFFKKIRASMDTLNDYTKDSTADLQRMADTLSLATANLPASKDIPRVTKVAPLYAVEGVNSTQELVISGFSISYNGPLLEVDGQMVKPNTATDTELRFPVPSRKLQGGKPALIATTLHLYERKTHLLWWPSYEPRNYPVRIALYPREIGRLTITPRREVATSETQDQTTPSYRCESPHGEGGASTPVSVVPTAGWSIDPKSIAFHVAYSNNGTWTMNTTSSAGFTAILSCSGFGIVKGPFGVVVNQGNQGVQSGNFTYTETRAGTKLTDASSSVKYLHWGDALTISDLPTDTKTVLVELSAFSGETLSLQGDGTNRFLKLGFDAASKIATITARVIDQVLRE